MNRRIKCIALALGLSASVQLRGENSLPAITCAISGVTNSFAIRPQAIQTERNELSILAFGGDSRRPSFIGIHLPVARVGVFRWPGTSGLSLTYSRGPHSSSMEDHYDASGNTGDTAVEVTVLKLGRPGEPVEGKFSGVLRNGLGRGILVITNGTFSLTLTNSEPKK